MKMCHGCGNNYDKVFEVTMNDRTFVFDSFECAAHVLAPTCDHCGCRILGHGIEADGKFFCCAHCSKKQGVKGVVDRVG
ncbi:MAG: hypothetical protein IPL79_09025 [Myxococcales bacterium]|nr:hypothetical protein [Myxococcales bacterium]